MGNQKQTDRSKLQWCLLTSCKGARESVGGRKCPTFL